MKQQYIELSLKIGSVVVAILVAWNSVTSTMAVVQSKVDQQAKEILEMKSIMKEDRHETNENIKEIRKDIKEILKEVKD